MDDINIDTIFERHLILKEKMGRVMAWFEAIEVMRQMKDIVMNEIDEIIAVHVEETEDFSGKTINMEKWHKAREKLRSK